MPTRGKQPTEEQKIGAELGAKHRELANILRLSNPGEKKKQKAVQIGKQIQELNKRKAALKAAKTHLTECYMVMYPDDPERYCTCHDWSPE